MSDDPKLRAQRRAAQQIRNQIALDTAGDEVRGDFFDNNLGRARRPAPGRRRGAGASNRVRTRRAATRSRRDARREANPGTAESGAHFTDAEYLRRLAIVEGRRPPRADEINRLVAQERARMRDAAKRREARGGGSVGAARGLLRSLGGLSLPQPRRTAREDQERQFRDQRSRVPRRARRSGNDSGR